MTKKFNIAAYCRSSVSTSHNNSSSIEHQKAIINDFIKTNYPDSTVTFYEDTEHSGTIVKNRPNYQAMRPLLIDGTYNMLIVKNLSRFSRHVSNAIAELDSLRDLGVHVILIDDTIISLNNK